MKFQKEEYEYNPSSWSLIPKLPVPLQRNMIDCGLFLMKNVEFSSFEVSLFEIPNVPKVAKSLSVFYRGRFLSSIFSILILYRLIRNSDAARPEAFLCPLLKIIYVLYFYDIIVVKFMTTAEFRVLRML